MAEQVTHLKGSWGYATKLASQQHPHPYFNNSFSSELNLAGNYLKQLPDEVKSLTHLTSINLARNKFSVFPQQLTELTALETINLEGNQIAEIPVERLASMPSLKSLNMKSNPLSSDNQTTEQSVLKFELLLADE
ncbi:leucine-rich repeat-containing protein 20 [Rhincodon typus]|uniref:leucine-rich repeat-containing protein 20 n=1 Tax=Rhincodon typus TaxID=259920 RepID=UPI00202E93BE|nr:leucine-rich repeat-containing protein 20 [Rhincodon typus]